jgi:carboxylate-amine ligase
MFTIGVEEEYQIVDAQTRALKQRGSRVLHALPDDVEEQASNELFLSQIEIGTPICQTLGEVREHLTHLRRGVIETAEARGLKILASGTHPFSRADEQTITPKSRYLDLAEDFQQLAREHMICGCHVHVGLAHRELAIEVMNRARGWMAPLIALAANSPFWQGDDTGYASFRTEVWRRWPMAGSPQIFHSRAEYDALVRVLVETGSISDETRIYWDMRPADRFETLEFRATDIALSVDEAVLIAGIVRALAQTCYDEAVRDREQQAVFVPVRPELLRAADWRAARYGLEGELIDVQIGKSVPAQQFIEKLLGFVRPALEKTGDWDEVAALTNRVLESGNGATRQRRIYEKTGKLEDVVDYVAQETRLGF